MTSKTDTAAKPDASPNSKVEGEGSYSATRDYNERTKSFIDSGKVDEAAGKARPKSDAEAKDLLEAEKAGRERAKP